jgi:soluble lytic murein transglycosylase-like protein
MGLLSFVIVLSGAVGGVFRTGQASDAVPYTGTAGVSELDELRRSLALAIGESELQSLQLVRANAILEFSSRFSIPADLAAVIHDEAVRAGLDPELAFRLVKVESNFNPRARSAAQAFGLAQVQVATARYYDPRITEEDLYDPRKNLRIGFRYLRHLHDRYANNMRLALLAYNVGPSRLQEILDGGRKPVGAYATAVLNGYSAGPRISSPPEPVSGR